MKVYYVYVDDWNYDDFDAIVVVAENEDRAFEIANSNCYYPCYFKEHQGEIRVEEVDLTKEHVILESFNAG